MKRREFAAVSTLAVAASMNAFAAEGENGNQQILELKKFHTLVGSKRNLLNDFLRNAAIPAANRLGIKPIGVFQVMFGENQPTLYVLIPHNSIESVFTLPQRLSNDAEFLEAGKEFIEAPLSDPAYVRMESSLMLAFKDMPKVEIPEDIQGKDSRIFELRIYESHSTVAGKKKVEMFNEGGEIAIFRKTGLNPVFFGETIIGPRMPNLTYMLGFESIEQRYERWDVFRNDPDWAKLSKDPQYRDTVSNITDIILRPTNYSQI